MLKCVILEPLGVGKEKLLAMAEEKLAGKLDVICYDTRAEDTETLIGRSRDADVVVLSNFAYRRSVIEHCPNLKMICVAFTGVDHIDMDYCRERGIMVCNCSGYATVAVAELVFGMLLSLFRSISACDERVRARGTKDGLVGFELSGKKFGIVGAGAIGRQTAGIAKAFGCEVFGYSRSGVRIDGVRETDLDTLLSTCDVISLHVPLTAQTKGLISAEKLALMKPSAVLVNTARGGVVDSEALAAALKAGKLAGACIDVFEGEPPIEPDHPLLRAPNVVATPHVAFATKESMIKRAVIVFENLDKWVAGTPQNVIK